MKKSDLFKREISYIKTIEYLDDFKYLIDNLPDYFIEIAASSTGKYHPKYALGEGGLLRHTKAAIKIGYTLLNNPSIGGKYTDKEKDLMLIALTLHDGFKLGKERNKYTQVTHPLIVGDYIKEHKKNLHFSDKEIDFLTEVIASHMGPWNTDFNGNEVLPKPKNKYQNFVHMCDYLASQKFLTVEFDKDNNIVE